MFAAYAARIDRENPLSGLELGERPAPGSRPGWTTVEVRAASLNHHDLWSLRGVGITEDRLPMILGCDAAGVDEDGNEVVVHSVIGQTGHGVGPKEPRSILTERYQGTFAERVTVPSWNVLPKPKELSFEQAACLPTAWLTAYRMLFTNAGVRPGDRVLVQGAGAGSPPPPSSSAARPAYGSTRPAGTRRSGGARSNWVPSTPSSRAPACPNAWTRSSRRSAPRPGPTR